MNYKKPIIIINEELTEGVYTSSGCYTATAYIFQKPQLGRGDYRIQLNAIHDTNHTNNKQTLMIKFNQPVEYVSSNGILNSGNNTSSLTIDFSYWQNPQDNIGLGELVVVSEYGLEIVNINMYD